MEVDGVLVVVPTVHTFLVNEAPIFGRLERSVVSVDVGRRVPRVGGRVTKLVCSMLDETAVSARSKDTFKVSNGLYSNRWKTTSACPSSRCVVYTCQITVVFRKVDDCQPTTST